MLGCEVARKASKKFCVYLPLKKSDERRFLQVGGRISQCLAAEHRVLGCEKGRSATSSYVCLEW